MCEGGEMEASERADKAVSEFEVSDVFVRAMNAHGDLVAALTGLLGIISVIDRDGRGHVCGITLGNASDEALAKAREALRLAGAGR